MAGRKADAPRYNVVSFRLSDEELELAVNKAGGRDRVGKYIRTQLFTVPPKRASFDELPVWRPTKEES